MKTLKPSQFDNLKQIEEGISNDNMIVFAHLTVVTHIYLTFILKTVDYWDIPNLGTLTLYTFISIVRGFLYKNS